MNTIAEHSVEINNNIEAVFSYVSDMENFGEWFPEVVKITAVNSQNHESLGKMYRETVKVPTQGEKEVTIKVVEFNKNKKFVTEGDLFPLLPKMTVLFTSLEDNKSLVNWKMQSRNNKLFFRLLLLPMIKSLMTKRAKRGLSNLKGKLDAHSHTR